MTSIPTYAPASSLSFLQNLQLGAAQCGDFFCMPLGSSSKSKIYIAASPDLAETILLKNPQIFAKSNQNGLTRVLGQGLLTNGQHNEHKKRRHLIQPHLYHRAIVPWQQGIVRCAKNMLELWNDKSGHNKSGHDDPEQSVQTIVHDAMLEVFHQIILGLDTTEMQQRFGTCLKLPLGIATAKRKVLNQRKAELDEITFAIIAERRKQLASNNYVVGNNLLEQLLSIPEISQNDTIIRDEILTLFAAGYETTTYALIWCLAALAHNPQAQRQLQQETRKALPQVTLKTASLKTDEHIKTDRLFSLPYLKAVWQETLRCYPTIPHAPRTVTEEITIPPYSEKLPVEARVFVSIYLIHRHPQYWQQPEQWQPERFLSPASKKHRLAYLPFGAGARYCVGRDLAWFIASIFLGIIIRTHQLTPKNENDQLPGAKIAVSLLPNKPIYLRLTPYKT